MSLLWTTAAWWNKDRDFEYEGDEQYPLRDPNESLPERGNRYVAQVAQAHSVPEKTARNALKHVHNHIESMHSSPEDFGFASSANQQMHYSLPMRRKLMDPKTWEGHQTEQVSLQQPLHASQNFIRPNRVAHNLFHPGHEVAEEDQAVGDPDYKPEWDQERREESREDLESSPEERALHEQARFMRRRSGRLEVVDGHHRVAADMLLGKSHTPGVVIHERDLED